MHRCGSSWGAERALFAPCQAQAEVISGDDFAAAQADPLRGIAASTAAFMNEERLDDNLHIAAGALGVPFPTVEDAQMLWLDRLGVYLLTKVPLHWSNSAPDALQPLVVGTA
jgi:hypothetical protein